MKSFSKPASQKEWYHIARTKDLDLLPTVKKNEVIKVPMSDYQFMNYAKIRNVEINRDKNKKSKGKAKAKAKAKPGAAAAAAASGLVKKLNLVIEPIQESVFICIP